MSPRKFLRNLRFLQILTQGNVVHRGRLFYLTATIFSRDPFDQVVKESGSNPDVVGSNPTTSRFFAPRGIVAFSKGKFRAGKLRAKSELRQFKNSQYGFYGLAPNRVLVPNRGVAGFPEIRFYLHKEFRDRQIRFYLHKEYVRSKI